MQQIIDLFTRTRTEQLAVLSEVPIKPRRLEILLRCILRYPSKSKNGQVLGHFIPCSMEPFVARRSTSSVAVDPGSFASAVAAESARCAFVAAVADKGVTATLLSFSNTASLAVAPAHAAFAIDAATFVSAMIFVWRYLRLGKERWKWVRFN